MADSQSLKKKKKKKSVGNSGVVSSKQVTSSAPASNGFDASTIPKNNDKISEILPLKVGMTAMFKDVEVTMTKCEVNAELPPSTSSKKKKKKSKQISETPPNKNNLLSFNENHIQLVNHPEISVTVSKVSEEIKTEPPKVEENSVCSTEPNPTEEKSSSSSKKKKKKKKKNKSESTALESTALEETAYTPPTYVKLPSSGDSLVLVVSHESFSNGGKVLNNSSVDKPKAVQNDLQTEKPINNASKENISSKIQLGNSVSIFPVPEVQKNSENNLSDKSTSQTNLQDNQNTISEKIEKTGDQKEEGGSKSKAQLKAERRAKQESQRAAKLMKDTGKIVLNPPVVSENKRESDNKDPLTEPVPKIEHDSEKAKASTEKEIVRKVRLFSHLPQCKLFENLSATNSKIHPAILEVGFRYSKGIIRGSNARCIGLLAALKKVVNDYSVPPNKDFSRDLESQLQAYLNFLNNCRPLSVSMINAVKFLKHQINHIPKDSSVEKAKESLCYFITSFVNEEILLAKEAIGNSASAKIVNGDVILVFAYSSLVQDVLCKAHNQNKKFHVVVVDSRPKMEGLEMLRRLIKRGLQCSYISINAVSYVMKEVSKVIVGAHALLSNGCVMSRLGCKQVALVASAYSVPVLVCCETYKFCERVLTDSFVHNELGEPEELVVSDLVQNNSLENWHDFSSLQLLNLLYDVTPPDLISMVITEKGVLPCTSVPVVLRVRHAGLHE